MIVIESSGDLDVVYYPTSGVAGSHGHRTIVTTVTPTDTIGFVGGVEAGLQLAFSYGWQEMAYEDLIVSVKN